MLSDYSEALIEMKRLIREAEDLCNKREFEAARQVVEQLRNESDRLVNWLWKSV